jgi:hypothetical protein
VHRRQTASVRPRRRAARQAGCSSATRRTWPSRPRRPPRRQPSCRHRPVALHPRAGTRRGRGTDWPSSGPADRRARTRRFATADAASGSARRSGARPLDGEPLAALVATPLQDDPAGPGAHPSPEPVRTCALALLWLVGALHGTFEGRRAGCAQRRENSQPRRAPTVNRLSTSAHRRYARPVPSRSTRFVRDLRGGPARRRTRP